MTDEHSRRVGDTQRLTKQISEADVALFELVTQDDALAADEPPKPDRRPRQAAPFPLLAAMLASAAARHLHQPTKARFERQEVDFSAPAYTDDVLCAIAEIAAYDATRHTLHIRARCDNQEGVLLAQGDFYLNDE